MKFLLKKIPNSLDIYHKITVYLSLIVFTIISTFLYQSIKVSDYETFIKLLVPLGVLLSAGLASISVMKSIIKTQQIEDKKEERVFNKIRFYINRLYSLNFFIKKELLKNGSSNILFIYKTLLQKEIEKAFNNDDIICYFDSSRIDSLINGTETLISHIEIIEKYVLSEKEFSNNELKEVCKINDRVITLLELIISESKISLFDKNIDLKIKN